MEPDDIYEALWDAAAASNARAVAIAARALGEPPVRAVLVSIGIEDIDGPVSRRDYAIELSGEDLAAAAGMSPKEARSEIARLVASGQLKNDPRLEPIEYKPGAAEEEPDDLVEDDDELEDVLDEDEDEYEDDLDDEGEICEWCKLEQSAGSDSQGLIDFPEDAVELDIETIRQFEDTAGAHGDILAAAIARRARGSWSVGLTLSAAERRRVSRMSRAEAIAAVARMIEEAKG